MDQARAKELIELIASSEPEHWDCPAVNDALARFVDSELDGRGSEAFDPGLGEHLERCPPCAELHESLLEIARLDADDALPSAAELWSLLGEQRQPEQDVPEGLRRSAEENKGELIDAGARFKRWLLPVASIAALLALSLGLMGWRDAAAQRAELASLKGQLSDFESRLGASEQQLRAAREETEDARSTALAARELASRNEATIELISRLDRNALALRDDGSWIRVFYAADGDQAVVYLGDMQGMPELAEGQYLECWLQDDKGKVYSAGIAETGAAHMGHWTVQAASPLGEHEAFMVTIEPEHLPIFEVALGRDG